MDPGPLRTVALGCLHEFILAELLPHLEPLPTGGTPPMMRLSPPVRFPYLPTPNRPLPAPEAYTHLHPSHLAENLVLLDIECGTRSTPAAYQNVAVLTTLADYHGHIIFNAGVKPPGVVPALTFPNITGLFRPDIVTSRCIPSCSASSPPKWSSSTTALTRTSPR